MAWTIVESSPVITKMAIEAGDELVKIKLACTSDGSASDYDLSATALAAIKGSSFYLLKIVPGTGADEPTGAFDCDIEDENNHHILDTNANAAAPTLGYTLHLGSSTFGVFPPIESHSAVKVSLVCATLGDEKKADFYLYFVR
jgi:hypothetical protein